MAGPDDSHRGPPCNLIVHSRIRRLRGWPLCVPHAIDVDSIMAVHCQVRRFVRHAGR
jgi:hypothetical protein